MESETDHGNKIAQLKHWTKTQSNITELLTDEQLLLFLHSCNFDVIAAEQTLNSYFTFKEQNPDFFKYPEDSLVEKMISNSFLAVLPKLTPEGDIVLLFKLIDPSPGQFIFCQVVAMYLMSVMSHLRDHGPPDGIIVLFDALNFGFRHLLRTNLLLLQKILFFMQEAAPVRIRGLHIININSIVTKLIAIAKPFMKRELVEMIQFHPDMESLHKAIPRECLVKEHQGFGPSYLELLDAHRSNILKKERMVGFY